LGYALTVAISDVERWLLYIEVEIRVRVNYSLSTRTKKVAVSGGWTVFSSS